MLSCTCNKEGNQASHCSWAVCPVEEGGQGAVHAAGGEVGLPVLLEVEGLLSWCIQLGGRELCWSCYACSG